MSRRSRRRASCLLPFLVGLLAGDAASQQLAVGDPLEDYLRVLQISGRADPGSFTVRPWLDDDPRGFVGDEAGPWSTHLRSRFAREQERGLVLTPPELRAFANSRYPVGRNDGAVWQGKGLTTALDAGAALAWRGLTVEVRPTLLFTQNAGFGLAPVLPAGMPAYAYPWRVIDWPQRFGPDSFWTLDPGQSEVRLEARGLSLGFGTKSLWWGPAIENPIIMSNNAPGFPHAFLGTDGPLGIGIGELELRWIWGRLQQSDWFDPGAVSDQRFLTGIVATYSPSFVEGLSVGATRVFYRLVGDDGVPAGDYFLIFQGLRKKKLTGPGNPTGEDEHDQMLSVFGRWVLPESGFEVYWEWARTDHNWELRDFLLEPEYSQAYTLGLQKTFLASSERTLAIRTELTHLERNATAFLRGGDPVYYQHGIVTQGYTQRGQIIGAGIGPGGNAQSIGADLYTTWGRVGTWFEREVNDNDAYRDWALANGEAACCHDVSFHWGSQALWFKGDFDLGAGMIVTREMNRWFYGLDLWNLNLSLSARWHPR